MALEDPTSGAGYGFGAKLPAADVTTVFNQQAYALDGTVGSDITTTTGTHAIAISGGTTYRVTGALTGNLDITLPMTGNGDSERVWLRFAHTPNGKTITVKEAGGSNVATITTTDEGLEAYWDGTDWRAGMWTSDVNPLA
jgi:hypothetical protein